MRDAMMRMQDYPARPPFLGLVLAIAGLLAIILAVTIQGESGMVLMWVGGAAFLGGQVWQGISMFRWKRGYLRAMSEAMQESSANAEARLLSLGIESTRRP